MFANFDDHCASFPLCSRLEKLTIWQVVRSLQAKRRRDQDGMQNADG
jgi:hypothetical protein